MALDFHYFLRPTPLALRSARFTTPLKHPFECF